MIGDIPTERPVTLRDFQEYDIQDYCRDILGYSKNDLKATKAELWANLTKEQRAELVLHKAGKLALPERYPVPIKRKGFVLDKSKTFIKGYSIKGNGVNLEYENYKAARDKLALLCGGNNA